MHALRAKRPLLDLLASTIAATVPATVLAHTEHHARRRDRVDRQAPLVAATLDATCPPALLRVKGPAR